MRVKLVCCAASHVPVDGAPQGVELAGVDVRDAGQDQRAEPFELSDQRGRVGEGLRAGQVRRCLREQDVDRYGQGKDRRRHDCRVTLHRHLHRLERLSYVA